MCFAVGSAKLGSTFSTCLRDLWTAATARCCFCLQPRTLAAAPPGSLTNRNFATTIRLKDAFLPALPVIFSEWLYHRAARAPGRTKNRSPCQCTIPPGGYLTTSLLAATPLWRRRSPARGLRVRAPAESRRPGCNLLAPHLSRTRLKRRTGEFSTAWTFLWV